MSQETSDKAQPKRDPRRSSDRASRPNPQDEVKSDVLESALGELLDMSDEDLLTSLSAMSDDREQPASREEGSFSESDPSDDSVDYAESADTAPESFGAEEANGERVNEQVKVDDPVSIEMDVEDDVSDLVVDDIEVSSLEDISAMKADDAKSSAAHLDDRIQEDPLTLSLIKNGIVAIDLISTALRNWKGSGELWREVARTDGVQQERVYAAVAKMSGYPSYTYLDAAPTRELVDELIEHLTAESLLSLLDRGILPVDLDPGSDDSQYRLMIVTHDPSDESLADIMEAAGVTGLRLYAPQRQVEERIEIVRGWLEAPFGMDFAAGDDNYDLDSLTSELGEGPLGQDASSDIANSSMGHSDAGDGFSSNGISSLDPEPIQIDEDEDLLRASDEDQQDDVLTIPSFEAGEELPSLLMPESHDRVIRSLLQSKLVTDANVQQGIQVWQKSGGKEALWRVVASLPGINREAVYEEAARVYAFKQEEITSGRPDPDFVIMTMETVADDQRDELLDLLLLPFEHVVDYETGAGRMVFVTPDPTRPEVNRRLHELDLGRFELRYAPESQISELLDELFPRKNEYLERMSDDDASAYDLGTSYEEAADIVDEDALDAEINRSKLINLFEATLVEATRLGASDIHILPNARRQIEIHFRLDGRLKKWHTEEGVSPESFISVVKDNSVNVDRFERDAAQDGFIQRRIDDTLIRFRVSILPIATANQEIRAESIVIRILDDRKVLTELSKLGMLDSALERFDQAIRQPHGMVILTGPTGSGKSTTLVAALHQVVTSEVNVLTVEDPVEYIINGVRQIKLSHKLNLESALRSILRHDPDIVMVGEMRDQHTAELAIKLANTGHLTFSTLHTNDAPAAVSRLFKMGVEPFLIAYAINLVVAQRLVRTVCPTCKTVNENPDTVLMKSLGWTDESIAKTTVYQANLGTACKTCSGMGYKGRRAVCETLYFTDEVRHLIAESGTDIDEEAIREAGVKEGMLTLRDSARTLVEMGETTVEEMLRVTGAE